MASTKKSTKAKKPSTKVPNPVEHKRRRLKKRGLKSGEHKPTTRITDEWRRRIQVGLLVGKVSKHALANAKIGKGGVVSVPLESEMLASQLKAAEMLMDRVIPRLQRTTHDGDPENPIAQKITHQFTDEQLDAVADALAKRL